MKYSVTFDSRHISGTENRSFNCFMRTLSCESNTSVSGRHEECCSNLLSVAADERPRDVEAVVEAKYLLVRHRRQAPVDGAELDLMEGVQLHQKSLRGETPRPITSSVLVGLGGASSSHSPHRSAN